MFRRVNAADCQEDVRSPRSRRAVTIASLLCLGLVGVVSVAPARAAVAITLGGGVSNPPPNLVSKVPETAIARKATLVPAATFGPVLKAVLDAQGFTSGNNWYYDTKTSLALDDDATFDITTYSLSLNPAGDAFAQTIEFALSPDLDEPTGLPEDAETSLHWLQYVNTNAKVNGFGYAIGGYDGFWQVDNGQKAGGAAAGPETGGPYYDSNTEDPFSTPYDFYDKPGFYSGVGTYLYFTVIPVWDVYVPSDDEEEPATETLYVGNYGLSWGFTIVPEPASIIIWVSLIAIGLVWTRRRRRIRIE